MAYNDLLTILNPLINSDSLLARQAAKDHISYWIKRLKDESYFFSCRASSFKEAYKLYAIQQEFNNSHSLMTDYLVQDKSKCDFFFFNGCVYIVPKYYKKFLIDDLNTFVYYNSKLFEINC